MLQQARDKPIHRHIARSCGKELVPLWQQPNSNADEVKKSGGLAGAWGTLPEGEGLGQGRLHCCSLAAVQATCIQQPYTKVGLCKAAAWHISHHMKIRKPEGGLGSQA